MMNNEQLRIPQHTASGYRVPMCNGLLHATTAGPIQQLRCTTCGYEVPVVAMHVQQHVARQQASAILDEEQHEAVEKHVERIEAALSTTAALIIMLLDATPEVASTLRLRHELGYRQHDIDKALLSMMHVRRALRLAHTDNDNQ